MRLLIVVALLLGGLLPAFAQDDLARRLELGRNLCNLSAEAYVEEYTDAYWPMVERDARIDTKGLDPSAIAALRKVFSDEIRRERDLLLEGYAQAYAKSFTADELQQLLKFYQSPLGAKLIATSPAIARDMLPTVQAMLAANLPAIVSRVEAEARRLGVGFNA